METQENKDLTYAASGVNVEDNVSWTKSIIGARVDDDRKKHGITHVSPIGGFAGAMKLPPSILAKIIDVILPKATIIANNEDMQKTLEYVLSSFSIVACTDGVGTKTMIAEQLGRLNTLGYDLLAMNVNDMVAGGATPIAFLDYIGCKGIKDKDGNYPYLPFIEGLIKACRSIDVELIGGETAEMGDNYAEFGSDLTGMAIGVIMDNDVPPVHKVKEGDLVFGLKSSGVHSNGYSLVRKVLKTYNIGLDDKPELLEGKTVADVLLEPTRLYVKQALDAMSNPLTRPYIRSMAHITGGGLVENIDRSIPKEFKVGVDWKALPTVPVFTWLRSLGVSEEEMRKAFNLGIGYTFVADPLIYSYLSEVVGEETVLIGIITKR